ncbi:hypothetical protein [Streptomyces rochei]|uniref:hypothetical protein n=1 Tax=Streptomyces rochei TaxID=1928 RepID=UPI00378F865D
MRHNGRDPIKASTMRPEHLNLRDGEPLLAVCPDCDTWRSITRSMIKPHRASNDAPTNGERRYYGDKPARNPRCPGSAQRILIDISAEEWEEKLRAAESTASSRRSARQHHKPIPAPATQVHRLASMPGPSAKVLAARTRARDAVNQHRSECMVCRTGRARCSVGRELEIRMGHTDATVRLAQEQHEAALRAAATPTIRRTQQWRRVAPSVNRTERKRRTQPAYDGPQESRPVPLAPKDEAAHDQRQAELGKQYAKNSA